MIQAVNWVQEPMIQEKMYSYKRYNCYLLALPSITLGVERDSTCQTGTAAVGHLHWSLILNTEFSFKKQLWNCASIIVNA